MKACTLTEVDPLRNASPELRALKESMPGITDYRGFIHEGGPTTGALVVTCARHEYSAEDAFMRLLGHRAWRVASISRQGQLQARLADQARIGRQRRPGERSPVPLPDWYDLTHIAYVHAREVGLDPGLPLWQYLPSDGEPAVNFSETLHLRQPV